MRRAPRLLAPGLLGLSALSLAALPMPLWAQVKKADEPKRDLTKPFVQALAPYQKAMAAKDYAAAKAAIDAARSKASNPDERYVVNRFAFDVANATNDEALQNSSMEAVIASGAAPTKELQIFNGALAVRAYNSQQDADTLRYAAAAKAAGATDPNLDVAIAETYGRQKDYPKAIGAFQSQLDAQKAVGQVPAEEIYRRIARYAQLSGDQAAIDRTQQQLVAAYPTPDNWRLALNNAMVGRSYPENVQLDYFRLMKLSGALKEAGDYRSYAELASSQNLNGEVVTAVDLGTGAGVLNAADVSDIYGRAKAKSNEDRSSLQTEFKSASSKASARPVALAGDALFGYGSYDQAIELYKLALTKPGVDADEVNLRLGIAQTNKGDYAGAKESFAKVKGQRQPLATYWTMWLDKRSAA